MDALSLRHVRAGGCPARQVVLACFGVGVVLRARRDRAVGGGTTLPLLLAPRFFAIAFLAWCVIRAARAYATRRDVTCRAVMMSAVTAIRDRTVHQTTENDVRRTRLGLSGGRPPRMKPSQPAELLRHTRRVATTPRAGRSRRCDRDRDRDRPAPRAAACADRPATAVVAAPRDAAGLARQRRLRGGGGSWRGVL
jgi:hypothetical protein